MNSAGQAPVAPSGSDAAAATRAKLGALAKELAKIADTYGTDAVALQVVLLLRTVEAGAVGPTEVRVVGPSKALGPGYLRVSVATGMIFDAESSSPDARLARVWNDLLAPALAHMESFEIEPAGLELVFSYGLQHFAELLEPGPDASEPFEARVLRIAIPAEALADLAADRITTDELLSRSSVDHRAAGNSGAE